MRTLWFVGGGMEAVPGVHLAKEMGLHVVVSDYSPQAPAFAPADDRMVVSTQDVEGTVQAAIDYNRQVRRIDGVICVATDVPLTVACVAQALGLPGIPVEAARLASDKLAMKERLLQCGVCVPWFQSVSNVEDLRSVVQERGFPLVVKPVDSRGARGVLRLVSGVDMNWAYGVAKSQSPTGRVMVEDFTDGPQISTESVLLNGHGYTLGFSDRNYEYLEKFSPYIIENGGTQPSLLAPSDQNDVSEAALSAGRALGINTGVVKGDMVLSNRGPMVIEIAARLSGGWFSTDQIPLATGVDFLGVAIRMALGEDLRPEDLRPAYHRATAIRYFFPNPGRVDRITGVEDFVDVPWVHKLMTFVGSGEVVESVTDHTKRAGCVITIGDTREEAVSRALDVCEKIRIETVAV